jgi:hypothetical protein
LSELSDFEPVIQPATVRRPRKLRRRGFSTSPTGRILDARAELFEGVAADGRFFAAGTGRGGAVCGLDAVFTVFTGIGVRTSADAGSGALGMLASGTLVVDGGTVDLVLNQPSPYAINASPAARPPMVEDTRNVLDDRGLPLLICRGPAETSCGRRAGVS